MKSKFGKIILGTANFGLHYGNKNKKLNNKNIKEILNIAKRYGINTIDTAQAYGDSEKKVKKFVLTNVVVKSVFIKILTYVHE